MTAGGFGRRQGDKNMKIQIPIEILKAATVYTSKDETRYNINCLSFEDGRVIATNGHSLLVWAHGAKLNAEGDKDPDFLMHFDNASLKFLKAPSKGALAYHYDTDTRVLSAGGQSITLREPPAKGDFPLWRNTLPDVRNLKPIAHYVSTEIIETFAAYARARKGKGYHGFIMLTSSVNQAFYLMPRDLADCLIVAMPMNSGQSLEVQLETIKAVSGAAAEVIAA